MDALAGIDRIEDPVIRAATISEVLAFVRDKTPGWRTFQKQVVDGMRAQDPKVPYRKIASQLRTSLGTVQSIERGHAGAWGTKPRATKRAAKGEQPEK